MRQLVINIFISLCVLCWTEFPRSRAQNSDSGVDEEEVSGEKE